MRIQFFIVLFLLISPFFLYGQDDYQKKINELEDSLKEAKGEKRLVILNNLAALLVSENPKKSIEYAEQAIKHTDAKKEEQLADLSFIAGQASAKMKDYRKSKRYYEKSIKYLKKSSNKLALMNVNYNLAMVYDKMGRSKKAIEYFHESLEIAKQMGAGLIHEIHLQLYKTYNKAKDYKNALTFYKLFMESDYNDKIARINENHKHQKQKIKRALLRKSSQVKLMDSELQQMENILNLKDSALMIKELELYNARLDSSLKEAEIKELNYQSALQQEKEKLLEMTVSKQKTVIIFIVSGIFVVSIFLVMLIVLFRQKRKANIKLQHQKEEIEHKNTELYQQKEEILAQRDEIEHQRDVVTKQNRHITESINYASHIQSALLTPSSFINQLIPEHFILFKPKDIVSGDFYWVGSQNNKIIIVAADCTGHGVPGAFMSMLGIASLNEIVIKHHTSSPDVILNQLRDNVKNSLRQTGRVGESKDGMDIALCSIDKKNNTLEYAGAYNPLYVVRKENEKPELTEVKGDRMPIGIYEKEKESFTKKTVELKKGDTLYIFSDGFCDQFGGEKGMKLKSKKFKQLLTDAAGMNISKQKDFLDEALKKWQGEYEQIDDILIFGFRV